MRYEIETIENRRVCHPTVFFPTGLNGIYSGIGFEQKKLSEYSRSYQLVICYMVYCSSSNGCLGSPKKKPLTKSRDTK